MITYVLKNPAAKVPTLIMLHDHWSGRVMKMSTGQFIHPSDWSATKHRPKSKGSLTTLLDRLADRVRELHIRLEADGQVVTPASLRAAYDRDIRTSGKRETMVEWIKAHPDNMSASVLKHIGNPDWNDINPAWFDKLQVTMTGYSLNYIGGIISAVQRVMKQAGSEGVHRNNSYQYKKPSEQVDAVYLTEAELNAIRKVELGPRQAAIRDRFLIGCFTGLRFSDNKALTADSIRGNMIYNKNIKTGTQVVVPIHPVVTEILSKYGGCLPPAISCQNTNKQIKLIAKAAGIKQWEKVCTHVSRRTFATQLALAGVPLTAIRKMTGHASEVNLNKYLRMSAEESALSIAGHEWFQR